MNVTIKTTDGKTTTIENLLSYEMQDTVHVFDGVPYDDIREFELLFDTPVHVEFTYKGMTGCRYHYVDEIHWAWDVDTRDAEWIELFGLEVAIESHCTAQGCNFNTHQFRDLKIVKIAGTPDVDW